MKLFGKASKNLEISSFNTYIYEKITDNLKMNTAQDGMHFIDKNYVLFNVGLNFTFV